SGGIGFQSCHRADRIGILSHARIEQSAKCLGGFARIVGLTYSLTHRHAATARRQYLGQIIERHAADHEERQRRLRGGLAYELHSSKCAELLRLRWECRPDADITRPIVHGLANLVDAVRADADERAGAENAPGVAHAHIVLSEADAIGFAERGDVRAI